MGLFVAKCIQDGRRVDLPLSQAFFKLMCTPWERGVARSVGTPNDEEDGSERDQVTPASLTALRRMNSSENLNEDERVQSRNSVSPGFGGVDRQSELLILESGGVEPSNEATSRESHQGEAGAKGADLGLDAIEISKDGCCKDDQVTLEQVEGGGAEEKSWFEDIFDLSDLKEVNPYPGKFLHQLEQLVQQRDAIYTRESLSDSEKEEQVNSLTLPASEENIPGAHLEDLW